MPTTTLPPIPTSRATPYLTLAELKRSPIYTQLQKLVPRGSQADNDAELVQIIKRVSALINGEVRQNLAATLDTESGWCRLTDEGDLRIHTRASPVIEVVSVTVGANPYTQVPITDLTYALTDPWRITISRQAMQNVGGIFGGSRCRRMWATWTYVNGYPVTTFAAPAAVGDTSITVTDSIGVIAGQTVLTIEDGKYLEIITPTAITGNVLTVEPLGFPHEVGVGVLDLPYDIQEVALILISRLHNTWSLSMGAITHDGTGARKNPSAPGTGTRFLCDPGVILEPYKRVW
jgi:hypothetical protein